MSKGKTVLVVTLPRTMSGMRAGRTLTLEPGLAKEWVEKGYVRLVTDDQESKPEATTKGKVAALLLALLLSASSTFGASRFEMLPSAGYTTGASASFSLNSATNLMIGVDVTACAGTPGALDLWLQASDDGGTTWFDYPVDIAMKTSSTATENATTTSVRSIIDNKASTTAEQFVGIYKGIATDKLRLRWVISTFTSCTFSASAVAK